MKRPQLVVCVLLVASGCAGSSPPRPAAPAPTGVLRFDLAQLYVRERASQAAVPLLQRVLREQPNHTGARVLYGSVLRDLGSYSHAEAQFRQVLGPGRTCKRGVNRAEATAGLALTYDLQGRQSAALHYHQCAIKLMPRSATYRNNYGYSLLVSGNTAAAIEQLRAALALDPSLAVAYNNLGFAHGRAKDYKAARRAFSRVGSGAQTLLNMSIVFEQNEDMEQAQASWNKAIALDPSLATKETDE